jgi:hypothetical protein
VAIAEWLTRHDPSDEKARLDLASAKLRFGTVLWQQGEATAGLAQLEEAERLNGPLREKNRSNTLYLANSVALKTTIADVLGWLGRINEALRMARRGAAEAEEGQSFGLARSQILHSQLSLAMVLARANRGDEADQVAVKLGAALEGDARLIPAGWLRAYFYSQLGRVYEQLARDASGAVRQNRLRTARAWLAKSREAWSRIAGGPILSARRQTEIQRLDQALAATHR